MKQTFTFSYLDQTDFQSRQPTDINLFILGNPGTDHTFMDYHCSVLGIPCITERGFKFSFCCFNIKASYLTAKRFFRISPIFLSPSYGDQNFVSGTFYAANLARETHKEMMKIRKESNADNI